MNGDEGIQFTGSTSGAILGSANGGGSMIIGSQNTSQLSGTPGNFNVLFGAQTFGFTTPS